MSLGKPLFWLMSIYLAVVFVITVLADLAPLWQFGVVAVFGYSLVAIGVWVGRHVLGIPASKPTELDVLLNFLRMRDRHWRVVTDMWVGRQVRITEDIQDARDLLGKPVVLKKGMLGEIIDLNDEPATPFRVRFTGHSYPVDVFVYRLELVSPVDNSP
jgi:hypothetical protein